MEKQIIDDTKTTEMNCFIDYVNQQKKYGNQGTSIYHYTSLEAFISIIKSKSLWATNCQYLNDVHEAKHIVKFFDELLEEMEGIEYDLASEIKNIFLSSIYDDMLKKTYIISFSRTINSIPMWNNYGKNGIVIEFEASVLKKDKKTIEAANLLMDVIYNSSIIKGYFRPILKEILSKINDSIPNVKLFLNNEIDNLSYLSILSLLNKDIAYSYEEETRLVYSILDVKNLQKSENYRVKNNLIIPYLNIEFDNLPIKSITVNPEQKDTMFIPGIEHLLNTHCYTVPVHELKIKTR